MICKDNSVSCSKLMSVCLLNVLSFQFVFTLVIAFVKDPLRRRSLNTCAFSINQFHNSSIVYFKEISGEERVV
jgi:hypothetical protein